MEDHSQASVDRTPPAAASQQALSMAWSVIRALALSLFLNAGKKGEDVEKILQAPQLTVEECEQLLQRYELGKESAPRR